MAKERDESEPDVTTWPTRAEVATKMRKSVTAVSRAQSAGKLHPRLDSDGNNRYDPKEVKALLEELEANGGRIRQEFAEYELDVVRSVIDLVRDPREKIDDIQFRIIEDQRKRIAELEEKLETQRQLVIAAEDHHSERRMAETQMASETRVKEVAANRLMATVQELVTRTVGGSSGVELTAKQLEELLGIDDFLTPEQKKAAQKAYTAAVEKERKQLAAAAQNETPKETPKDNAAQQT